MILMATYFTPNLLWPDAGSTVLRAVSDISLSWPAKVRLEPFYEIFPIFKKENMKLFHDFCFFSSSVYIACVRVLTNACIKKKR